MKEHKILGVAILIIAACVLAFVCFAGYTITTDNSVDYVGKFLEGAIELVLIIIVGFMVFAGIETFRE